MIKNYFKIAWRNLWRHKRMTMINVAGLGIGMAATVLIVLWVQNELSFDERVKNYIMEHFFPLKETIREYFPGEKIKYDWIHKSVRVFR